VLQNEAVFVLTEFISSEVALVELWLLLHEVHAGASLSVSLIIVTSDQAHSDDMT
jgi:hypothetical protein